MAFLLEPELTRLASQSDLSDEGPSKFFHLGLVVGLHHLQDVRQAHNVLLLSVGFVVFKGGGHAVHAPSARTAVQDGC